MKMQGPDPPSEFVDNGCGPKTWLGLAKHLVPDGMRHFLVGRMLTWTLACRYHDYHWQLAAEGAMTYAQADRWLYRNMRGLLLEQGATVRARVYPALYWVGVRLGSMWVLRPWRKSA